MDNIESEIKEIVAQIIERSPQDINPDAKLVEELGVDSMMALEILAAMEKKYKISIPEDKLAEFSTLNKIIAVAKESLAHKK